jgi:hypothetical protein
MNDRHEEIRKLQERLRITTPKPTDLGKGRVKGGELHGKEFIAVFQTRAYTKPPEDKR